MQENFQDSPDLLIGLATDLQNLFALKFQLLGQSADVLVQSVNLVVQIGNVLLPATDLLLQIWDAAQKLVFLQHKVKRGHSKCQTDLTWECRVLRKSVDCVTALSVAKALPETWNQTHGVPTDAIFTMHFETMLGSNIDGIFLWFALLIHYIFKNIWIV